MHGDEKKWIKFNREKPDDWQDLQVQGVKRGLAINHAGVGSHMTCNIQIIYFQEVRSNEQRKKQGYGTGGKEQI